MAVTLRSYAESDFPFIRTLFLAYVADERQRVSVLGIPDDFADSYLPDLIRKAREEKGIILIAESEMESVGFIAALPKEPAPWDGSRSKVIMVMEAHVKEGIRRQGIGRAMFAEVEGWAAREGYEWITLGTFAGNSAAHAFYRARGFQPTYHFFGKPIHASPGSR